MESDGREYSDVFSEAKELGYVESDARLDIGGIELSSQTSFTLLLGVWNFSEL